MYFNLITFFSHLSNSDFDVINRKIITFCVYFFMFFHFVILFYKDFFTEIKGIPLISRKVLNYGVEILSDKERNNLDKIRESQIRKR